MTRPAAVGSLLWTALVLGCSGSLTGPTPPAEPSGTVLTFDFSDVVALRDPVTGGFSIVPGIASYTIRYLDQQSVVMGGANQSGEAVVSKVEVATGTITVLGVLGTARSIYGIAPSPDGSRIALVMSNWYGDGKSTLHQLTVATGAVTLLWDGRFETLSDLEWHPDGKRLFGYSYDGAMAELVQFDFRGAEPAIDTLVGGRTRLSGGLSVDPDGRDIVVGKFIHEPNEGDRMVLHTITLSRPDLATSLGVLGAAPSHSPNGEWLAYVGDGLRLFRPSDGEDRAFPGGTASGLTALDWQ